MSQPQDQNKYGHAMALLWATVQKSSGWPNDCARIERDLIEWSRHRPDLHHALIRVGARLATFLLIEKMGD